jgi:hypothetical protein
VTQAGRLILLIGLGLVVLGAVVWTLGKLGFRGLPGDIRYESENVKVYIPIVTCLVASVLLSVLFWIVRAAMK